MANEVRFEINFNPHAGQTELLDGMMAASSADIFTVAAARGFGKTLFITAGIVVPKMLSAPDSQILWVAPFCGRGGTVDALDLKSGWETSAGSKPVARIFRMNLICFPEVL